MVTTDPSGTFTITSNNHPQIIPSNSYFLEIKNLATAQMFNQPVSNIKMQQMASVGTSSHIQMGDIQVPWTPVVPVIAKINGREFKYPGDIARAMSQQFRSNGSAQLELLGSFAGQPSPDTELDALLAAIEAEGRRPGFSDKVNKFLSAVAKAMGINLLTIRKSLDVVTLVLEKCANPRFNTQNIKDFSSFRLDTAVKDSFGMRSPFFLMLYGRASFSVVLFAVGCVARGQKISVSAADVGPNHVTSVSV